MRAADLYAWDAAVADYCSFMAARGSNEMSLRPRRSHLGALAREVDCGPWEVTQAQLFRFMGRAGWKPETRKSARTAVKGFYGWALDNELIVVDPSRRLGPPAGSVRGDCALTDRFGKPGRRTSVPLRARE